MPKATPKRRRVATTLDPKVFIEAARQIAEEETTCCLAICDALGEDSYNSRNPYATPYHRFLNRVLRPKGGGTSVWYRWGWDGYPGEDVYLARTLGLLLLAELLKDGSAEAFLPR